MHDVHYGLVLGYHGCDAETARKLLNGDPFEVSSNSYDWLGDGVYFWERDPRRGFEFANDLVSRKRNIIRTPTVVGAVLALGRCLDLTTRNACALVQESYQALEALTSANAGTSPIPENSADLMRRYRDRAVIELLFSLRAKIKEPEFDTVRGVFEEGPPAYPGAGFRTRTHIQIAVRNPACILGVFRVSPALFTPPPATRAIPEKPG